MLGMDKAKEWALAQGKTKLGAIVIFGGGGPLIAYALAQEHLPHTSTEVQGGVMAIVAVLGVLGATKGPALVSWAAGLVRGLFGGKKDGAAS